MSYEIGALRGKLATEIPVTKYLGLEVVGHDARGLTSGRPLVEQRQPRGQPWSRPSTDGSWPWQQPPRID